MSSNWVLRYGSLGIIVLQTTMTVLLLRYSRTSVDSQPYIASTAVLSSEVCKFILCLGSLLVYAGIHNIHFALSISLFAHDWLLCCSDACNNFNNSHMIVVWIRKTLVLWEKKKRQPIFWFKSKNWSKNQNNADLHWQIKTGIGT